MSAAERSTGPLALVGGGEWREGCDFDVDLLAASGGAEVAVLPTAAAYEHPGHAVERATRWFEALGATVIPVPTVDPGGSSPRVSPSRATSASRGSSRGGTAATARPAAGAVGRSL